MEKSKFDRVYNIMEQAATIKADFAPERATMDCTIFIGACYIEKRLSLQDIKFAINGYHETDCSIWQKGRPGTDYVCYRSNDFHVSIYIDIDSIRY